MNLDLLCNQMPAYAKDIKLNLTTVLAENLLTQKQIYLIAIAASAATRHAELYQMIVEESSAHLSPSEQIAAKTAASIMAMNNVYYRFVHLANKRELAKLPAKLRMNQMAKSGIDSIDFELCSLAVSAINGCGMCLASHTQALLQKGVMLEQIQAAVRIAATLQASAQVLWLEAA